MSDERKSEARECECCGETELGDWGFKCGCNLFLFCKDGCGKCVDCCTCVKCPTCGGSENVVQGMQASQPLHPLAAKDCDASRAHELDDGDLDMIGGGY